MSVIPGTGPVFEFEWLTASRRWQQYATRSLFAAALLVALAIAWVTSSPPRNATVLQTSAHVAMRAYYAIVGTQLALVLLAAPAATAGSICIDKARGTMTHVLVTDLTDSEIVLGKLAAKLMPVLGLIGCTLPIVAICTLLGGIDPAALAGAYAVTAALAVLCCSLALTMSIWARKTHEVLLATYLIVILLLLGQPMMWALAWIPGASDVSYWLGHVNPVHLVFGGFGPWSPRPATEIAAFCAICVAASAALVLVAICRVRAVARRQAGLPARPARSRRGTPGVARRTWLEWLPGPSLDGNPVLWREWHRNRPSGWARRLWGVYFAGSAFFMIAAALSDVGFSSGGRTSLWVNGFEVAIGILLLSVTASTSLAEERARGSLDVLMTTPLSTLAIVWGKWLGGFRGVPSLVALPALLAALLAWNAPRSSPFAMCLLAVGFLVAEIVVYGAFITSLGLALATLVPRLGRAVAICVAVDVFLTVGTFFLLLIMLRGPDGEQLLAVSPFGGPAILTMEASGQGLPFRWPRTSSGITLPQVVAAFWAEIAAIGIYAAAAAGLLVLTLQSFDDCLGRVSTGPEGRRPPRLVPKPKPARADVLSVD